MSSRVVQRDGWSCTWTVPLPITYALGQVTKGVKMSPRFEAVTWLPASLQGPAPKGVGLASCPSTLLRAENKETVKAKPQRASDWSMESQNFHAVFHWEKKA